MATAVGQNQYGDDIYNTPNGQKTGTQITQELAAANWDGKGDPVAVYNQTSGGGSGATPGTPGAAVTATGTDADVQKLVTGIQQLLGAQSSGNKDAIAETIREFNATFGLDTQKFQDDIRRFNQNFEISQAGLTGQYQGAQTQQAQLQAANIAVQTAGLTGYYVAPGTGGAAGAGAALAPGWLTGGVSGAAGSWGGAASPGGYSVGADGMIYNAAGANTGVPAPAGLPAGTSGATIGALANAIQGAAGPAGPAGGVPTMQYQNQIYNQQMGAINAAAALQANPFRQAQVIGQAGRVLQGLPTAGFQAPNVVSGVGTAGGNTQGGMGYLQALIDDIKDPTPNQTTAQSWLNATPTPNKIDSASFLRSTPTTQNLILQSMQEKYGIDPTDALTQIKNTLPQFNAPQTTGVVRRG